MKCTAAAATAALGISTIGAMIRDRNAWCGFELFVEKCRANYTGGTEGFLMGILATILVVTTIALISSAIRSVGEDNTLPVREATMTWVDETSTLRCEVSRAIKPGENAALHLRNSFQRALREIEDSYLVPRGRRADYLITIVMPSGLKWDLACDKTEANIRKSLSTSRARLQVVAKRV